VLVLRIVAVVAGLAIIVGTLLSALKTVVVPRGYVSRLTRRHFRALRHIFGWFARPSRPYEERDRVLAFYAPVALITLPAVWVVGVLGGFCSFYWGVGAHSIAEAFVISGSSLFTLGFVRPEGTARTAMAFVEAGLGLGLVSLMISYLPTIYGAFSRREAQVGMLEVRAGLPPSACELLIRYQRIGWLDRIGADVFERWEEWFVDVEESHTSHPALVFFRSPHPDRNWVTAGGCVLDTASLVASTVDLPHDSQADLLVRTGFFALRRIADYFGIDYPTDPAPTDPISITRAEFDEACADLRAGGVPLRNDLDQAWRDFSGWRVNYDVVLIAMCELVNAPIALWSSDRRLQVEVPDSFASPRTLRRRRRATTR
jgi:hypothetical protein